MTSEEIIEYLSECDPDAFLGELLEVPEDVLEETIGEAYSLAEESDLQTIRQQVLQDMKAAAERNLERYILRHSKHLRSRLEGDE